MGLENVAKEIESLDKPQGRELASRIGVIMVHLMNLQAGCRVAWEPMSSR